MDLKTGDHVALLQPSVAQGVHLPKGHCGIIISKVSQRREDDDPDVQFVEFPSGSFTVYTEQLAPVNHSSCSSDGAVVASSGGAEELIPTWGALFWNG